MLASGFDIGNGESKFVFLILEGCVPDRIHKWPVEQPLTEYFPMPSK